MANAFLLPGVKCQTELVPSHGASRRWLGDNQRNAVMAGGHENLSSTTFINTSQNSFDLADHLLQLVENDTANITDVRTIASHDPDLMIKQRHKQTLTDKPQQRSKVSINRDQKRTESEGGIVKKRRRK